MPRSRPPLQTWSSGVGVAAMVFVLLIGLSVVVVLRRAPAEAAAPASAMVRAQRAIAFNRLIRKDDLAAVDGARAAEISALTGKYATRTLKAGETFALAPSAFVAQPTLSADASEVLIGVRVARAKADADEVNAEGPVYACVGQGALPLRYRVAALLCPKAGDCTAFVRVGSGDIQAAQALMAVAPAVELSGAVCAPAAVKGN